MLKLINLYVIEKIFDEAEIKTSALSKMVYVNCLIHYFKNKDATPESAVAFEIMTTDFDFSKFKKQFHELHKAGIVTINGDIIKFNNVWGAHIDKSQLGKPSYTPGFKTYKVKDFEQAILNNAKLSELCQMKYKLHGSQLPSLIKLFIKEQDACETIYKNESECIRHCGNWIGKNIDKTVKTVVRSSAKRLGQV